MVFRVKCGFVNFVGKLFWFWIIFDLLVFWKVFESCGGVWWVEDVGDVFFGVDGSVFGRMSVNGNFRIV